MEDLQLFDLISNRVKDMSRRIGGTLIFSHIGGSSQCGMYYWAQSVGKLLFSKTSETFLILYLFPMPVMGSVETGIAL